MKNIFIIIIGFYFKGAVQANLEYLEILNLKAWNAYALLNSNLSKTLEEEARTQPRGFFGQMFGKVFGTLPKNPPQQDLDEMAQIFSTLNVADISTLFFLKKNCNDSVFDPTKDPNLCVKYPEILIKQVQNRLDVVNTKLIRSKGGLKCPPNWLKHTISATEILKDIDTQNQLEYKVKEAITKAMLSGDNGDDKGKDEETVSVVKLKNSLIDDGKIDNENEKERSVNASFKEREVKIERESERERDRREKATSKFEYEPRDYRDTERNPDSRKGKSPCFSIQLPLQIITQPVQTMPIQAPQPQIVQSQPQPQPQIAQDQAQAPAPAQLTEQQQVVQSTGQNINTATAQTTPQEPAQVPVQISEKITGSTDALNTAANASNPVLKPVSSNPSAAAILSSLNQDSTPNVVVKI